MKRLISFPVLAFGLLLAFAGIGLIEWVGHRGNATDSSVLGDGLLVLATICWAVYTNLAHRFVHVYGSLKTTTVMMITGTNKVKNKACLLRANILIADKVKIRRVYIY